MPTSERALSEQSKRDVRLERGEMAEDETSANIQFSGDRSNVGTRYNLLVERTKICALNHYLKAKARSGF